MERVKIQDGTGGDSLRGVVLRENEIVRSALNEGIINEKPMITIGLLIRYYFSEFSKTIEDCDNVEELRMLRDEVFDSINQFMINNYNDYIPSKWQGIINKTIDMYKDKHDKWNIIDIESISISKEEWSNIIKLEDRILERLAFVMLIYQKINTIKNPSSNGWINQDISDIFKEAGVTIKGDKKRLLLNKLYRKEYIRQSNNCLGTSFKIEYINDGEDKIVIDNFNNIISYYYEYRDKSRYRVCSECGIRFEIKKYKKKYCTKCAKVIKQLKDKENIKNKRVSKNSHYLNQHNS